MNIHRLIPLTFLLIVGIALGAPGDVASPPGTVSANGAQSKNDAAPMKLIVLDPGHGGFDPGATGPGGVLEKDVVLEVAKRMKETLEKRLPVKVVFTRDGDVFIPLRERAEIANRLAADLFISIHANAAKRRAWGFETYFLSQKATDQESRKLALKENAIIELPNEKDPNLSPDVNSDLEGIFLDMAQTNYIKESEGLAMIVQDKLANILMSPDRGVKQAPFAVLTQAAMPAILVEIGFVSSRKEVKLLTDPEMQDKIAAALASSVQEFARRRALKSK